MLNDRQMHFTSADLLRKCWMISIIDGSLIDLRRRAHLSRSFPQGGSLLHSKCSSLKKRNYPSFARSPLASNAGLELRTGYLCSPGKTSNEAPNLRQCPDVSMKTDTAQFVRIASRAPCESNETDPVSEEKFNSKDNLISKNSKPPVAPKCSQAAEKEFRQTAPAPPELTYLKKHFKVTFDQIFAMSCAKKDASSLQEHRTRLRRMLDRAEISTCDLQRLKRLLLKFLLNQPLTPADLDVSDLELILFCVFLVKKNYPVFEELQWSPATLKVLQSVEIKKRSEQNYKVILKRFFKKVIRHFNIQNGLEPNDNLEFYRANFETLARRHNEDWRLLRYGNVFNENMSSVLQRNQRKSKRVFAKVLKQNEEFMRQLEEYLDNGLELGGKVHGIHLDYTPILGNKVKLLTDKWRGKLYSNKNLKARVCKFVQDLILNNKVKLPWGYTEIDQGVRNVRRLFREA